MADTMEKEEGRGESAYYELALLLKSEDDAAAVATLARQHGGEIVSEPRAKRLSLAYPIKGNTEASFVTFVFKAPKVGAKKLESDLRLRQDVIRSMIVRTPLAGGMPVTASAPTALPERPSRYGSARPAAPPREPRKAPAREPLSNEALENLLKEI